MDRHKLAKQTLALLTSCRLVNLLVPIMLEPSVSLKVCCSLIAGLSPCPANGTEHRSACASHLFGCHTRVALSLVIGLPILVLLRHALDPWLVVALLVLLLSKCCGCGRYHEMRPSFVYPGTLLATPALFCRVFGFLPEFLMSLVGLLESPRTHCR